MKFYATLATFALLVSGCQSEFSTATEESTAKTSPAVFNVEGAPTFAFSVPDMMCEESCVEQVRKALSSEPGVKDVQVDFKAKRATVAVNRELFNAEAAIAILVDYQFTNSQLVADE